MTIAQGRSAALAVLLPLAAAAQADDAAYCQALSQQYARYVVKIDNGNTRVTGNPDGMVAMEQCKTGQAAQAIPVLERKLRDAKVNLPPRG
jgi:hypothetical protein